MKWKWNWKIKNWNLCTTTDASDRVYVRVWYLTHVNYVIFSNYYQCQCIRVVEYSFINIWHRHISDTRHNLIRHVVDWNLKWKKKKDERSITEMRVDEVVIIGKREWTNGANNDVVFRGVVTGCSRLFRLLVWERNGIGEDRMTIG